MKFAAERSDVVGSFEGGEDKANKGVLDKLESVKRELGKVGEQRVAIVKFGRD